MIEEKKKKKPALKWRNAVNIRDIAMTFYST